MALQAPRLSLSTRGEGRGASEEEAEQGEAHAVFAIVIKTELLIPILCGIFLVENISVMIQVSWFKYTKKKYGAGRRVFLMAPLHHHYQKKGYVESKIVTRFWIVGIILAVLTIVTLKVR